MDAGLPRPLIDAVHDAALDRALWPQALTHVSRLFGGAPTQIGVWDLEQGDIPLGVGVELAPDVWEIAAGFATPQTNPLLAIAMRSPLHKAVDQGTEFGLDRFRSLDMYEALYRPQGIMPMCGAVCVRSDTAFAGLAIMRSERRALAGPEDLAMVERISRHIGRAVELAALVGLRSDGAASFEAALSQAHVPILLLDANRAVVWRNPPAEDFLRAEDGVTERRRRLVATGAADEARLAAAFGQAIQGFDAVVTLQRRDAPSGLGVRLSPLWRSQARSRARVMVQLSELRTRVRFDPKEAACAFDLTPAEARVACEICAGGGSLAKAGRTLGVSVNTVKTLLQRAYDKVGVRSQVELTIMFASVLRPKPDLGN